MSSDSSGNLFAIIKEREKMKRALIATAVFCFAVPVFAAGFQPDLGSGFSAPTVDAYSSIVSPQAGDIVLAPTGSSPGFWGYGGNTLGWLQMSAVPQQLQSDLLTTGTSWTSPAGISSATIFKVTLIGGGGGGGGAKGAYAAGSGGASGAIGIWYVSGLSPSTSYSYSIGFAGSAGANTGGNGGNGGSTTMTINGIMATAPGGNAGLGSTNASSVNYILGGGGNAATNVTLVGQGNSGGPAICFIAGAPLGGIGGASPLLGGAASAQGAGVAGVNGNGYGAGASGAASGSATGYAGGAGAQGTILLEWVQ
jgi:hypothetical protein